MSDGLKFIVFSLPTAAVLFLLGRYVRSLYAKHKMTPWKMAFVFSIGISLAVLTFFYTFMLLSGTLSIETLYLGLFIFFVNLFISIPIGYFGEKSIFSKFLKEPPSTKQ